MLVAGGHDGNDALNVAEVISLNPDHERVPTCNKIITPLPGKIDGLGGGSVGAGKKIS